MKVFGYNVVELDDYITLIGGAIALVVVIAAVVTIALTVN